MNRPFDAVRYAGLLEGLEVSEVRFSDVLRSTSTTRFDPEYFQRQHLLDAMHVVEKASAFCKFRQLGISVDASAFYPSIEAYYDQGDLPFLRVADVDSVINFETCTRIPASVCDQLPTLSKVAPGDIVFTKGGSVARVGLVTADAAVSRDLIFLNSSKLPETERVFLYLYFQTGFFNRALVRSSSQTAQPHLTITLVRELPIFRATEDLKERCLRLVRASYEARAAAIAAQHEAEYRLLSVLGLDNWKPPEPLSYVRSSRDAFAAERLDAEYFMPKAALMEDKIKRTNSWAPLGDLLAVNVRGSQPAYSESGMPVVNSKHVINGEVRINDDNRVGISSDANTSIIRPGDVLINGTGVGTIGRAAPYLHEHNALPDNHVTILRPKPGAIDPVYLAVFLNSLAGQLQVNKWLHGSSGQIELYPSDIAQFIVWLAPKAIQLSIQETVEAATTNRRRATDLLNAAKRAVEIAIEDSELAAMRYLDQFDLPANAAP